MIKYVPALDWPPVSIDHECIATQGPIMSLKGENGIDVDPALDDRIELLASSRCRCVLYYFAAMDEETATIDDLCDHVLDHDPSASDDQSVTTGLYHNTLPKLEESGVVDYDGRSKTVRYRGVGDSKRILSAIKDVEAEC